MIFKNLADFLELFVNLGEHVLHLRNGHRGAHARDDVLALCVGEEFAHQSLFARGGVTRERDARAAVVAHVTERHHLHVDSGTPAVGNVVVHTIDVGAGVVPGTEHRFDRGEKLFLRIVGEILADLGLIFRFELVGQRLEIVRVQLDVLRNALLFLHLVDEFFKILLADFHDDVGEHLNESSVAVPSPTGIPGLFGNRVDHVFVQTEVEDGVHHAGHGSSRAGTDGNEQRVDFVPELLAADLFHLVDVFHDLRLNFRVDLSAVFIILRASLRGNGEPLRNGKTDVGHFRKVRALAAQQLAHLRITLGKEVAILFCHN